MADFPTFDPKTGCHSLTPVMPASELEIADNPAFELAYWRYALDTAQQWRLRLGMDRHTQWDKVRRSLAPLPRDQDVYLHAQAWTDTYTRRNHSHPDPVGVCAFLPITDGVDAATAARTVRKVWDTWNWNDTWGWDFPWMATAAARTGQPQLAVEALLKEAGPNSYPAPGINCGWYLPGNGALLYAVAMMAAGWDDAPRRNSPGFPDNSAWTVAWEGLRRAP